jgi:hypothetical protein
MRSLIEISGEDHDWQARSDRLNFLNQLFACLAWHIEIRQQQPDSLSPSLEHLECVVPADSNQHVITFAAEHSRNEITYRLLVVDEEDCVFLHFLDTKAMPAVLFRQHAAFSPR